MGLLAFKTTEKAIENYTVKDNLGNELEIPKYGCLTVGESIIYGKTLMESLKENQATAEFKTDVVVALLISRLKIQSKKEITFKDLFDDEDGNPIVGEPMVEAIYEFFEKERQQWKDDAVILGKDRVAKKK